MDLTILVNFSQICQSEISGVVLTILTNFRHFRYNMHFYRISRRQNNVSFNYCFVYST